jgi:hypothetical protein
MIPGRTLFATTVAESAGVGEYGVNAGKVAGIPMNGFWNEDAPASYCAVYTLNSWIVSGFGIAMPPLVAPCAKTSFTSSPLIENRCRTRDRHARTYCPPSSAPPATASPSR